MSELRDMIRELLLEELARTGQSFTNASMPAQPRNVSEPQESEVVSIRSSGDLARFATRVLALADDPATAKRIRQGNHPFVLNDTHSAVHTAHEASLAVPVAEKYFEKGVVGEKDIDRLADGIGRVTCSATVCLTPLARDALRRRGIKIVRKKP